MSNIILICGPPASSKSTLADSYIKNGFINLNRDLEKGNILSLIPKLENLLNQNKNVVLDNTFPTIESRRPFVSLAEKFKANIDCILMQTTIEDCTFNVVQRTFNLINKFPTPEVIKEAKHPNIFPPAVLFKYKKDFQEPSLSEGFNKLTKVPFVRKDDPLFTNKALFLDYDGCLRTTINGNGKFPILKDQIKINTKCKDILLSYKEKGYKLLGVSNQSGVSKGDLSYNSATELFDYTNKLLGVDIEYKFCPHKSTPISCYCRKPQVGFFVEFMLKYKLSRKDCIMVGDLTSDKTFAKRCGMQYIDQSEFYK